MAGRDIPLIAIMIFGLAMGLFVVYFITDYSIDAMLGNTQINGSEETVDSLEGISDNVLSRLDYLVFVVFIVLLLGVIITGWLVGGIPLFMILYFIIIVITTALSAVLANTWESITQASVFGATIAQFPLANHIVLYLPYYMTIIGMIGIIVMFAKPREA